MKKHDKKFEKVRFQGKKKYILESLDSKLKKREKILFQKKKVNLSKIDEN